MTLCKSTYREKYLSITQVYQVARNASEPVRVSTRKPYFNNFQNKSVLKIQIPPDKWKKENRTAKKGVKDTKNI